MTYEAACQEIADAIEKGKVSDYSALQALKLRLCKKYRLRETPKNSSILALVPQTFRSAALSLLRRKPVRSVSGVSVIAVMTKPLPCPHGRCTMCPGGPNSYFGNVPQSYTGREPSSMRAIQNDFDPFRQVTSRIRQLEEIGHEVSKIELIIQSGTFTALSSAYQHEFIKGCLDACNGFVSPALEDSLKSAETSARRVVGLTIETKPDWFYESQINLALSYGATRVELGVQSVYDDVLKKINRGHDIAATKKSFALAKDSAFKIVAHMMPFLPGSAFDRDVKGFRELFSNPAFRPDELKVYPTEVLPGTPLYDDWKAGNYTAPTTEEVVHLVAAAKKEIPPYVRIKRILRDIPSTLVAAGPKKSNLRQLVEVELRTAQAACRCIRCREIGLKLLKNKIDALDPKKVELCSIEYAASGGREFFLSFEEPELDTLVALLRLRFPAFPFRPEISSTTALIRELHVYGTEVPRGVQPITEEFQHRGYGRRLLEAAENISREAGMEKLVVIAGIGVKEYYRKLGFVNDGPYVSKKL